MAIVISRPTACRCRLYRRLCSARSHTPCRFRWSCCWEMRHDWYMLWFRGGCSLSFRAVLKVGQGVHKCGWGWVGSAEVFLLFQSLTWPVCAVCRSIWCQGPGEWPRTVLFSIEYVRLTKGAFSMSNTRQSVCIWVTARVCDLNLCQELINFFSLYCSLATLFKNNF